LSSHGCVWRLVSLLVSTSPRRLEVKGESAYQNVLESIAGPKNVDRYNLSVNTVLLREPDNPNDENAIGVYATNPRTNQAAKVDYIERGMAEDLAPAIDQKNAQGEMVGLVGHIRGGWRRADGNEGHYGIWLLYDPDDFGL